MASAAGQTQAAFLNNLLATSISGATTDQLNRNANLSLDALGTGYTGARGDVTAQFQPSLDSLGRGFDTARTDLTTGYGAAGDATRAGIAQYQPWINSGTSADAMYTNALGLNGAGGNAAATDAFHAGPQYQWNRDQAIDASARKMNSLGIGGSGNTLSTITTLGENLANNEYGSWLSNLNNASGRGLTAASGAAQGNYNLANLGTGLATNLGNLDTSRGTAEAGLRTGFGSSLGNLDVGQGTGAASIYTGLGNSLANANTNFMNTLGRNNSNAGEAQDAASMANSNMRLGLLGLGVRGAGSLIGTGGIGAIGGLGGLFSGGASTTQAPY
jgi:hypothetical protein